MEPSQIVDATLRALAILAWPVVVLLLSWPLRDRLPTIGAWIGTLLEQRAFKAQTPLGSFDVGPPPLGSDESLRADGRAMEEAASRAENPDLAEELLSIGAELDQARDEIVQARAAEAKAERARADAGHRLRAAQEGTDILERRIAAHAAALYQANPEDFRTISVWMTDDSWSSWDSAPGGRCTHRTDFLQGTRRHRRAVPRCAFSSVGASGPNPE